MAGHYRKFQMWGGEGQKLVLLLIETMHFQGVGPEFRVSNGRLWSTGKREGRGRGEMKGSDA